MFVSKEMCNTAQTIHYSKKVKRQYRNSKLIHLTMNSELRPNSTQRLKKNHDNPSKTMQRMAALG